MFPKKKIVYPVTYHWGETYVDGRIILRGIFRKWEGLSRLDGAGSG
jgi:hypothetical protein